MILHINNRSDYPLFVLLAREVNGAHSPWMQVSSHYMALLDPTPYVNPSLQGYILIIASARHYHRIIRGKAQLDIENDMLVYRTEELASGEKVMITDMMGDDPSTDGITQMGLDTGYPAILPHDKAEHIHPRVHQDVVP
ncbi:hypothetical protein DL89DRAFT_255612 [Linderina pennispora]|uniref:Uncharacterized protein n=1 Tax=Linderina pennispora TaxID=61395 RepID=A0A1Y1WEJ0_9FUNG|nr:uncharacterized protein DL89DRAFT_255612 [Linderina pennispora]ORX71892.1 hypothetical protein DL89DRAFT_255612 [Linderina pennispora]